VIIGVGRIVVGNPERVTNSALLCIGVVDVAVAMFFAIVSAVCEREPFGATVEEDTSSQMAPARID
jgi:hypothetical protein